MKLKKIASLMLAGIMAVSMLAGCATTSNEPEQPNQPEEPTATGYSVELAANLSDAAKKDYITYEDNADDLTALEDALGNMSSTTTAAGAVLPKVVVPVNKCVAFEDTKYVISDLVDSLGLMDINSTMTVDSMYDLWDTESYGGDTVKYGALFVVDGTVDVDKALAQTADYMEGLLETLANVNNDTVARYTFDYTVSASVANQALEPFAGYTLSANFILVTVTRVATAA